MQNNIDTFLNNLDVNETTIDISSMNLNVLPNLSRFHNIIKLDCSENKLKLLPDLPPTITELNCSSNYLTELPDLPKTLTDLNCERNYIKFLPTLPETLTELSVAFNDLLELPILPMSLEKLYLFHLTNKYLYEILDIPEPDEIPHKKPKWTFWIKNNPKIIKNYPFLTRLDIEKMNIKELIPYINKATEKLHNGIKTYQENKYNELSFKDDNIDSEKKYNYDTIKMQTLATPDIKSNILSFLPGLHSYKSTGGTKKSKRRTKSKKSKRKSRRIKKSKRRIK